MGFKRYVANRLRGRRKTSDDDIDFNKVILVLGGLDSKIIINVRDYPFSSSFGFMLMDVFSNQSPENMRKFLEEGFQPMKHMYFDARYQVFSGSKDKRHYLELERGEIRTQIGDDVRRGRPYRKTILCWDSKNNGAEDEK